MKKRSKPARVGTKTKNLPAAKTRKTLKPSKKKKPDIDLRLAASEVNHRLKKAATEIRALGGKASRKAVSMVKLVGVSIQLKECNNHLQGLYAELGKIIYDQRRQKNGKAKRQPAGTVALMERITEMKKKKEALEQEVEKLKKT